MRVLTLSLTLAALVGCASHPPSAKSALPLDAREPTRTLAAVKDDLDAADRLNAPRTASLPSAPMMFATAEPSLRGLGFAQISGQPGKTQNEKRLMAIRAARVDAMRDLTEQVHGVRISASTSVRDAVVADDSLSAVVQGTLRGAKTLRVTAKGSDSYEVEMELDRQTIAYIVRALRGRI